MVSLKGIATTTLSQSASSYSAALPVQHVKVPGLFSCWSSNSLSKHLRDPTPSYDSFRGNNL